MPTLVNVNGDVNRLAELIPDAILGKVRPTNYDRLRYGYLGGSSDNWDWEAAAADFAALLHGWPTDGVTLDELLDWLDETNEPRAGYMEKEFLSMIYTRHQWHPALAVYGLLLKLASDSRFSARAERLRVAAANLRSWLRAGLGWAALTAYSGKTRLFTTREAAAPARAQVLTATGAVNERNAPVSCIMAGRRGWTHDPDWFHGSYFHLFGSYLYEFGMGGELPTDRRSDIASALRAIGVDPTLTTVEEWTKVRAAVRGEAEWLRWCVSALIGSRGPRYPYRVVRTSAGITTAVLAAGGSATSTLVAVTGTFDGRLWLCGTDDGIRGTGADKHINGHLVTRFDLAARTIEAKQVADGSTIAYPQPPVTGMPIAPGDVLFDVEWSGDPTSAPVWHMGGPTKPVEPPATDQEPETVAPPKKRRKPNPFVVIAALAAIFALLFYCIS